MENKFTAIISEDIIEYQHTIEQMLAEVAPEIEIVGKATTLKETEQLIMALSPSVVFLDIQFEAEGRTAFDMLNEMAQLGKLNFQIVFLTAHSESKFLKEAFKLGAVHYLTKPIDKQELKESLSRLKTYNNAQHINYITERLQQVEDYFYGNKLLGKLTVESRKGYEVIDIKDIVILEADGRYTNLRLTGDRYFTSSKNLGYYENKLISYQQFVRIHANKIINLNFVKKYIKGERIIELAHPFNSHIASKERFRDFLNKME